ncbi:MAG: insulinase family protein, partial [candidate division Zixibacteria bacterium]|nr:insulinase family protein [candidate division Zixibacteria bacterium]
MRQTKIFYYSLSIILGLMMINMNGCSDTRIKISASKRVLENGLTVIVKEDHKSPLFTIDTWVKAGYYNEPDSVTGISHLLEHMFFKGTEKRGLGEIKGDTKKLGGRFNAGTIYEHTHYYTILPSEYLEEGVEIQSDALRNSTFDDEELSKEKEVVVQEIKRKYDNPSQYSYEKMLDLMFDTHRMGRWRMGTPEQVRGISRNELVDYYKKYYTPDNVILVVVGDVDSSEVYSLIEKYYGDWSSPECKKEISPSESVQRQLRHEIMRSDIKQPYIYMGFKTPGMLNEDTYALQILAYVLGRGKSSRLYKGIVEELQWASTAACELYALEDLGILNINVQPMGENIIDIENEVFGQIRLIKERGIPESELSKAKNNLESAYLFGMEEVTNQSEQLAIFEQYGDYKYLDEHLLKLNAVTVADIKRVAEDYLDISKCSIIEHLPDDMRVEKLKDEEYAKILSNAYARFSIDTSEDTECLRPTGTNIDRDDFPPVKFTLSDNKKIIIKENHSLPIVSVMIGFKGGRCFET